MWIRQLRRSASDFRPLKRRSAPFSLDAGVSPRVAFRRLSLFNVKTQPLIGTLLLVLAMSACSAEIEQGRSRELFERETKKAEHGDQVAAFHVGFLYRVGIGTTRDPEMALRWYEIAGPRGGWNAIGDMYNKGDGVARDLDQAALYYRRAADAGEPIPMYSLGCLHADGRLLEDETRARLDAEAVGRLQIDLGMRLAAAHVVGGDGEIDVAAQAERVEHALEVAARR